MTLSKFTKTGSDLLLGDSLPHKTKFPLPDSYFTKKTGARETKGKNPDM